MTIYQTHDSRPQESLQDGTQNQDILSPVYGEEQTFKVINVRTLANALLAGSDFHLKSIAGPVPDNSVE